MRESDEPDTQAAESYIARILPRHIRERVFEPAFADLLLDDDESELPANRRQLVRFSATIVLVAESFRLALPAYFWYRGRVTRLGRTVAVLLLSSTVIVVLLTRLPY